MQRGHYEVSAAVAENSLLRALRSAKTGTFFLADGFSCRTQADDLAGVEGFHLAQLLDSRAARDESSADTGSRNARRQTGGRGSDHS
ncbi:hypothetical protein [Streptomyces sp. NPDC055134]